MILTLILRALGFLIGFTGSLYCYDQLLQLVNARDKNAGGRGPTTTLGVVATGSQLPGGRPWTVGLILSQIVLAWAVWTSLAAFLL